jgi:hypothetical protein
MLFASGSGGDDYGDYDDDQPYDDQPAPQSTRRSPGAQRGGGTGGSGNGGSGGGGGRQRSVQFQPEERYWTEYLRIALPIIGLLLMIGLFWYWASQLTDDGNGGNEPISTQTPGTVEVITPPASTPEPTQEQVVAPPTEEVAETPDSTPDEAVTPEEETPEDAGAGEFAAGDFVVVAEGGVNMRSEPTTEGELVSELAGGEVLEIQSGPEEADGYQWYEVIVEETGDLGWVAAASTEGEPFIEPASE